MPEVIKIGEFAEVVDRWPHTVEMTCSKCRTVFKLTPQDSRSNYYTYKKASVERGYQRDSYSYEISFPCPACESLLTVLAPSTWTPDFAKGNSEMDRMKAMMNRPFNRGDDR